MFNNQPSYDYNQSGKRIAGYEGRKMGELSLAWTPASNELNDFQLRKQKNKEVAEKPNSVIAPVGLPARQIRPSANGNFLQHDAPTSASSRQQPEKVAPRQNPISEGSYGSYAQPEVPSYSAAQDNEMEVMGYLRKYEKIDDMPQEELQKVMAYYDSLKKPQEVTPRAQEAHNYGVKPLSTHNIERREPIKPKETAGGIIYGGGQVETKPPSRFENKNRGTFSLGDGYNYFKEDSTRKATNSSQHQQLVGQGVQNSYNPRADYKKMGGIHLG